MPQPPARSIKSGFLQVEPGHWFCFNSLGDFRLKHIPNSLRAQQLRFTLKHKLVLLEVPQSSGHLGSGVVVGSGGRVTPSAQCLHTNFAFSSHLKTSHKPPATPVLMATHPAFRPAGNKAEFTQQVIVKASYVHGRPFNPEPQAVGSNLHVTRRCRGSCSIWLLICAIFEPLFTFYLCGPYPQLNYNLKCQGFGNILHF